MKYFTMMLLLSAALLAAQTKQYSPEIVPKKMSVQEKKVRFYALVNPSVQKVHAELMQQFKEIQKDINAKKNTKRVQKLKEKYQVSSDEALLYALKPHPKSIALAQAAMESSWATSRFFIEAKNIFGMWSVNPNESRIAASEKREGKRTIWLKKFATLEASVRAYYELMGRARTYKEFRKVRYETNDPFKIIKKLDRYSEMGAQYPKELGSMIRYNKLTKYDK